ncbi:hypothetical protein FI667_g10688, partial [Globisporangium splendens]
MAAALLARNVLLASRVRVGATASSALAARAMSSMSTANFGAVSQNPAIMMLALNNAPAQSVVDEKPFVNNALIFETGLDLPTMELPELNQIGGLDSPTDVNNGALCIFASR